jgi:uncharacterized membrane protein YfcA
MAVKSRYIFYVIILLKAAIIGGLIWQFIRSGERFSLDDDFWIFLLVGFVAQIIDGTLGMAYGVTCSSFLLNLGVPPAVASASVHTAEVFTTGVSGISHLVMKNVDKKLFFRIVIPGIIGAVLGAFLLSEVLKGDLIKPFVAGYLLVLGILIIVKSFREALFKDEIGLVSPLGLIGGFLDAIGGGGWGPIVTSNIIRKGKTPQLTIGTVNTAEFFVAFASTGVFIFFLGLEGLETILGLIIGGIIAAPLGAYLVRYIKPRLLMFIVGCVIIITSTYTIYKSLT